MSPTVTQPAVRTRATANPATLLPVLPEAEALFPPSAELGEQLQQLAETQAVLDRRAAEELARLRELQDRD